MARTLISLFILALPLLEIAGFVVVGRQIGVLGTIGLVLLSGVVGAMLLRRQGLGALRRAQMEAATGGSPDREIVHGTMILLAGILLMIPGFVTDIIGLLLFIPAVREQAWKALRSRIAVRTAGFARPGSNGRGGRVVDLDETEYRPADPKGSPWRQIDGD